MSQSPVVFDAGRGVPHQMTLDRILPHIALASAEGWDLYGTQILQYQIRGVSTFAGFLPLRRIIGEAYGLRRDNVESQMFCGNGGMEMNSFLMTIAQEVKKRGVALVEGMTYNRAIEKLIELGYTVVGIPFAQDGSGVDLNVLEAACRSLKPDLFYSVPWHQNPTGINFTVDNIREAGNICGTYDVLHIADICYHWLNYSGVENPSLNFYDFPYTAFTGSDTKIIGPGPKHGWARVPPRWAGSNLATMSRTRLNPNYPSQAAIFRLHEKGIYQEHLGWLRKFYAPRMAAMNQALTECFPESAAQFPISGGCFAIVVVPGLKWNQEEEFRMKCASKGMILEKPAFSVPLFGSNTYPQYGGVIYRLTFFPGDPENIQKGIAIMKEVQTEMGL